MKLRRPGFQTVFNVVTTLFCVGPFCVGGMLFFVMSFYMLHGLGFHDLVAVCVVVSGAGLVLLKSAEMTFRGMHIPMHPEFEVAAHSLPAYFCIGIFMPVFAQFLFL